MNSTSNGSVSSETKAYYISGHGSEGEDSFIVPEGCMIVVQQQYGNLGYPNPDNLELNLLKRLPLQVLQQPDVYIEEIFKSVGPVSIFKPGDKCPNFVYSPLACYEAKNKCHTASGVIDLEKFQDSEDDKIVYVSNILSVEDTLDKRIKPFKYSIYPSYDQVSDVLFDDDTYTEFEEQYHNLAVDFDVFVNTYINRINDFEITQKKLCELHKGIYYNFVCRELSSDIRTNLIGHNSNLGKNVPIISSIIGLPQDKQNFFKRRLEETLGHRKEGAIKWYERYGKPTNGGRRKQSRRRRSRSRSRSIKYHRTIKRSKCSLSSA